MEEQVQVVEQAAEITENVEVTSEEVVEPQNPPIDLGAQDIADGDREAAEKLAQKVQAKIDNNEALDNKDLLALQGKVEIFDPSVGAFRQMEVGAVRRFVSSLESIKEQLA